MRKVVLALSVIATFLILSAALGLRTTEGCDADTNLTRDGQKMQCYYSAAVSAAYLCGIRLSTTGISASDTCSQQAAQGHEPCHKAISICDEIYTKWEGRGGSIKQKAELLANHCFYDVAKITRNVDTCYYIIQHEDVGTQLFGDQVTREMCDDEVHNLAKITPEKYYCENEDNICTIVFVLPLLLGLAIVRRDP